MNSGDRYLTFHAMETIAVCATGVRAPQFSHVVAKLEDTDEVLRSLSMFLISNAEPAQLEAALSLLEGGLHREHQNGLRLLLDASAPDEAVLALLQSDKPLNRRYGAVAAARMYEKNPRLIDDVEATEDGDLSSFVKSFFRSRPGVARSHDSDR
jgi:hypothetical protein